MYNFFPNNKNNCQMLHSTGNRGIKGNVINNNKMKFELSKYFI